MVLEEGAGQESGTSLRPIGAPAERRWHFQAVHHGVWDYDLSAPPNLTSITVDWKLDSSHPSNRFGSDASWNRIDSRRRATTLDTRGNSTACRALTFDLSQINSRGARSLIS